MNVQKKPSDFPFSHAFFSPHFTGHLHSLEYAKLSSEKKLQKKYENSHAMAEWNASSDSFYLFGNSSLTRSRTVSLRVTFLPQKGKVIFSLQRLVSSPTKLKCAKENKQSNQNKLWKPTRENRSWEELSAEADSNAGWTWVSHVLSLQGARQPHYSGGILHML